MVSETFITFWQTMSLPRGEAELASGQRNVEQLGSRPQWGQLEVSRFVAILLYFSRNF